MKDDSAESLTKGRDSVCTIGLSPSTVEVQGWKKTQDRTGFIVLRHRWTLSVSSAIFMVVVCLLMRPRFVLSYQPSHHRLGCSWFLSGSNIRLNSRSKHQHSYCSALHSTFKMENQAVHKPANRHFHVDSEVVHYHDSPFLPEAPDNSKTKDHVSFDSSSRIHVKSVLVILNSPIERPPSRIFDRLWNLSSFTVCADGGANRLYDATVDLQSPLDLNDQDDDKEEKRTTELTKQSKKDMYIPDLIRGDLDSLRSDVQSYYQSFHCKIERDSDQDTNDLDKALQAVRDVQTRWNQRRDKRDHASDPHPPPSPPASPPSHSKKITATASSSLSPVRQKQLQTQSHLRVYAYGAFGGRFDQEMASIQALYKWSEIFNHHLVLYGDENCAFLLPPGVRNEIRFPPSPTSSSSTSSSSSHDDTDNHNDNAGKSRNSNENTTRNIGEGPTCGLIPIGTRCEFVKTTGLQWNLDGTTSLEFGGLVSTSNRVVKDVVTVQCSHPLIFTAEMRRGDRL